MCTVDVSTRLPLINDYSKLLHLTALTSDDSKLYCAIMAEPACIRHVGKLLPQIEAENNLSVAIKLNNQRPLTSIYLRVSLLSSGQNIGIASINQLNIENKSADIGRMLLPRWQGQGLGSELSRMLIKWLAAEMGVINFTKHIRDGNAAAIKSALKLGFSETGTLVTTGKEHTTRYQLTFSQECARYLKANAEPDTKV